MSITALKVQPPLPLDLPDRLRELATEVECGAITSMIVAYVKNGDYCFLWPSSKNDSIILTTLAQTTAIDRMRA